mmetsp:Transcript_39941/g.76393  ORF Transcript_39941/g.76393 Transcript_39941/m.76393 type:complete len:322 (+) Transcript_39941:101-1066(+)
MTIVYGSGWRNSHWVWRSLLKLWRSLKILELLAKLALHSEPLCRRKLADQLHTGPKRLAVASYEQGTCLPSTSLRRRACTAMAPCWWRAWTTATSECGGDRVCFVGCKEAPPGKQRDGGCMREEPRNGQRILGQSLLCTYVPRTGWWLRVAQMVPWLCLTSAQVLRLIVRVPPWPTTRGARSTAWPSTARGCLCPTPGTTELATCTTSTRGTLCARCRDTRKACIRARGWTLARSAPPPLTAPSGSGTFEVGVPRLLLSLLSCATRGPTALWAAPSPICCLVHTETEVYARGTCVGWAAPWPPCAGTCVGWRTWRSARARW